PYVDPGRLSEDGGDDPFAAMGVKIVPENVSNVAKTGDSEADAAGGGFEKIVALAKDQSLRDLLVATQISEGDADGIIDGLSKLIDVSQVHAGEKLRIAFAHDPANPGVVRPLRLSVYDDGAHQATVARADDNSFVRADEPSLDEDTFADNRSEEHTSELQSR